MLRYTHLNSLLYIVTVAKVISAAAVRHELGEGYEWCFVEGSIPATMDPGKRRNIPVFRKEMKLKATLVLKGYYPEDGKYFGFVDFQDSSSLAKPIQDLHDYIIAEGPFDIVMALSAGAALASLLLIREAQNNPDGGSPFKGAIFFSGNALDYDALMQNQFKYMEKMPEEFMITIPTANIWGQKDEHRFGPIHRAETSARLSALCDPKLNSTFIHDADTPIPSAKDEAALVGASHAIRMTIDAALSAH
ncbi:hypothetical protein NHQ30_010843 [Ciborinia camelliae]|nr:hypothetical protein NHQ30_010843 [Ciborinia camelliae]